MTVVDSRVERLAPLGIAKPHAVVVAYNRDRSGMAALRYAAKEARLRPTQPQVIHQLAGDEVPDRFSTVREYLGRTHCPVALIPEDQLCIDPLILVCGVDRSPVSRTALAWAAGDAARRGVTVLALGAETTMVVPEQKTARPAHDA